MDRISEVKKEIKILVLNDGKQIVGAPYRKITPYNEHGQMEMVTWFDIRKNGETERRVNAAHVQQVIYK